MASINLKDKYQGFFSLWISSDGARLNANAHEYYKEDQLIAVFKDYPHLKSVYFQGSVYTPTSFSGKITDALLELTELEKLVLLYTSLEDISFLRNAKKLRHLGTSDYINGTEKVRQLKSLSFYSNSYPRYESGFDLSVLTPLRKLEHIRIPSFIDGDMQHASSRIYDVTPLKHLPKLQTLDVDFGGDIGCFSELTQIKSLVLHFSLYGNPDISPLGSLTQLEKLVLFPNDYHWYGCRDVVDIAPLSCLVNVSDFRIKSRASNVKNFAAVANMTRLQRLECQDLRIRTLKPLEKLTGLEELNVADNASIRDIRPLRNLAKLRKLHLGGTKVTDISPLSGLRNLTWICLNGLIADLSPLASMTSLRELYLDGYNSHTSQGFFNDVSDTEIDLTPLSELRLDVLDTGYCRVKSDKDIVYTSRR
jgi:internalin A